MVLVLQQIHDMSYFYSIILTIVLVISIVILLRKKKLRQFTLAAQIPGPKGHFIVGSLTILIRRQIKFIKNLKQLCKKYKHSLFKFWFFNKLVVCVSNADDVEEVMNSLNCFQKNIPYSIIEDVFSSKGLITNNNIHDYKRNR
ncbi:uncharacterized protein LOC126845498 [Adelges cooleyi]|uniref:uncharacterized protein LOC126845498 n=1 Tax=Adelges cooleyi TaxID=133065 RepID=UPI0021808D52|nr:uncharacterized protein LOC126845498 [Adelges cooleyi]